MLFFKSSTSLTCKNTGEINSRKEDLKQSLSSNRLLGNKCQGVVLEFDSGIQYLESGMYVSFSPHSDYSVSLYYVTRILHIYSYFKNDGKTFIARNHYFSISKRHDSDLSLHRWGQWVLRNIKCDSSENGTCRFCRAIHTDLKRPKERVSKFKKSYADKIEKAVSEFNSLFKIFMTKEKILVIKTKSQMLSILGILPNGLLLIEFGNNLTNE